jgi:hypothetical protein
VCVDSKPQRQLVCAQRLLSTGTARHEQEARSVKRDWDFVSKGTEISLGKFVPEHLTPLTLDLRTGVVLTEETAKIWEAAREEAIENKVRMSGRMWGIDSNDTHKSTFEKIAVMARDGTLSRRRASWQGAAAGQHARRLDRHFTTVFLVLILTGVIPQACLWDHTEYCCGSSSSSGLVVAPAISRFCPTLGWLHLVKSVQHPAAALVALAAPIVLNVLCT